MRIAASEADGDFGAAFRGLVFAPWGWGGGTNKKRLPADAWTRDCRGKSRGQETGGVTSVSPQARAGGGWDWGGGWDRGWWPLRQREEKKQLKRQDKKTHCQ